MVIRKLRAGFFVHIQQNMQIHTPPRCADNTLCNMLFNKVFIERTPFRFYFSLSLRK